MWPSIRILHRLISPSDTSINLLGPASRYPVLCQKLRQVFPLWSYPRSLGELWRCSQQLSVFTLCNKLHRSVLETSLGLIVKINWEGTGPGSPRIWAWGVLKAPGTLPRVQPISELNQGLTKAYGNAQSWAGFGLCWCDHSWLPFLSALPPCWLGGESRSRGGCGRPAHGICSPWSSSCGEGSPRGWCWLSVHSGCA